MKKRSVVNALSDADARALLAKWKELNATMMSLPIEAIEQLMAVEITGSNRSQVLIRLHGRYTKLRRIAERVALLQGVLP